MAKLSKIHLLLALAFILFATIVQAQWPWSGGGQDDDDDDDDYNTGRGQPNKGQPKGKQPNQPNYPWSPQQPKQPQPKPTQQPNFPWNNQPKQPNQPWQPPKGGGQPPRSTVTVTRTTPRSNPQPTFPTTPRPTNPPVTAQPEPSRTKTWSQPSQWGPPRAPFGPNSTPSGPQTIPTTTTEPYKEPVPYLTVCGRTKYNEYDVSNALINGCYYKNKTQTVNNSEFPKPFANRGNRFNFGDTRPPYYEFPLIDSAGYIGGPPGPDRVIFNEQCYLAGEITQTNAQVVGQFTECQETY